MRKEPILLDFGCHTINKFIKNLAEKEPARQSQGTQVDLCTPVIKELQRSLSHQMKKYRILEERMIKPDRSKEMVSLL